MRARARRIGLGRLRDRIQSSVHASPLWRAFPPRRLKDLDLTGALPANAIALTFDDGPDPVVTPQLLRVLESHAAPATFFMCGLAAQRHPDLVRAVLAAGHAIGGHTWDHQHKILRGLPDHEWRRQIDDTHALLADLSGAPVRWFRPPRGIIDRHMWTRLRQGGVTTLLWSIDGWDCTLRDSAEVAAGVLSKLGPGDITLLHDANANYLFNGSRPPYGELGNQESTVHAADIVLRAARERGLAAVSLIPR
ncbi:MAG: polysaccharide deacetylase family protein [Acidobacteria bacterium]|nr:MAG: polysaccharide deacetylase family protein [Acidobacteriota bacterium]